jgi:hypothetical protein
MGPLIALIIHFLACSRQNKQNQHFSDQQHKGKLPHTIILLQTSHWISSRLLLSEPTRHSLRRYHAEEISS